MAQALADLGRLKRPQIAYRVRYGAFMLKSAVRLHRQDRPIDGNHRTTDRVGCLCKTLSFARGRYRQFGTTGHRCRERGLAQHARRATAFVVTQAERLCQQRLMSAKRSAAPDRDAAIHRTDRTLGIPRMKQPTR